MHHADNVDFASLSMASTTSPQEFISEFDTLWKNKHDSDNKIWDYHKAIEFVNKLPINCFDLNYINENGQKVSFIEKLYDTHSHIFYILCEKKILSVTTKTNTNEYVIFKILQNWLSRSENEFISTKFHCDKPDNYLELIIKIDFLIDFCIQNNFDIFSSWRTHTNMSIVDLINNAPIHIIKKRTLLKKISNAGFYGVVIPNIPPPKIVDIKVNNIAINAKEIIQEFRKTFTLYNNNDYNVAWNSNAFDKFVVNHKKNFKNYFNLEYIEGCSCGCEIKNIFIYVLQSCPTETIYRLIEEDMISYDTKDDKGNYVLLELLNKCLMTTGINFDFIDKVDFLIDYYIQEAPELFSSWNDQENEYTFLQVVFFGYTSAPKKKSWIISMLNAGHDPTTQSREEIDDNIYIKSKGPFYFFVINGWYDVIEKCIMMGFNFSEKLFGEITSSYNSNAGDDGVIQMLYDLGSHCYKKQINDKKIQNYLKTHVILKKNGFDYSVTGPAGHNLSDYINLFNLAKFFNEFKKLLNKDGMDLLIPEPTKIQFTRNEIMETTNGTFRHVLCHHIPYFIYSNLPHDEKYYTPINEKIVKKISHNDSIECIIEEHSDSVSMENESFC